MRIFKWKLFFLLTIAFISAQTRQSTHQIQSEYYKTIMNPPVDRVTVLTGLDVLLEKRIDLITGKSIALVTNQTGIDRYGIPNYKRLLALDDVHLKVIFSPEHGLFGEADEEITYNKKIADIPRVISLYGSVRKPTSEMLQGVDLIIYDIQDIGARFYTYISTLGLVMEAAGALQLPVLVLDRPNPIRSDIVEGPLLDLNYQSFVGKYPIPIRYGWTIGELAKKIVEEQWIVPSPPLNIVSMEGWNASLWYDETTLPWVKPSPNIPDLGTAIIYPGMCLLEGTNVSEGRGTEHPFKWFGAPWINGKILSEELNKLHLPGVAFVPISFTPVSIPGIADKPKYQNQLCDGIEIRVITRNEYQSLNVGVSILKKLQELYPENIIFKENRLNRLWGSDTLLNELQKKRKQINFYATGGLTILLLLTLLIK